jgi:hypothetical protein
MSMMKSDHGCADQQKRGTSLRKIRASLVLKVLMNWRTHCCSQLLFLFERLVLLCRERTVLRLNYYSENEMDRAEKINRACYCYLEDTHAASVYKICPSE